jgi:hypothetical protein
VSDVVSVKGGEAYGNEELFRRRTAGLMDKLMDGLPGWLR